MTSTIDVAALEEAAGALLGALYIADERRDGFKDDHAPTLVAAFADTGWSVADVLAFGEDSELAGLLPESHRDRELAEIKSRAVISPWPTLRADLVRALEPAGNQARPEEDRAMRAALHALDVLPQALRDAAPSGPATRVPSSFASVGPLAAPRTLPGDLGCLVYAEGATVFFGESEHGKSLAAQAIAVEAMSAGLRVVHLDGEQGGATRRPTTSSLVRTPPRWRLWGYCTTSTSRRSTSTPRTSLGFIRIS